ncbi:MAG TPA: hypothetical protein VHO69_15635 [Phototrophicaceae bacterium]|nr:hypothetical protein [Phototrophicaceae bacterium]
MKTGQGKCANGRRVQDDENFFRRVGHRRQRVTGKHRQGNEVGRGLVFDRFGLQPFAKQHPGKFLL